MLNGEQGKVSKPGVVSTHHLRDERDHAVVSGDVSGKFSV
jgi:hypothetical protein